MLAHLMPRAAAALTAYLPTEDLFPDPHADAPKEVKDKVNHLLGFMKYLGVGCLVAGVMSVAIYAALAHRRGDMHHELASRLAAIALGGILLASATTLVSYLS